MNDKRRTVVVIYPNGEEVEFEGGEEMLAAAEAGNYSIAQSEDGKFVFEAETTNWEDGLA